MNTEPTNEPHFIPGQIVAVTIEGRPTKVQLVHHQKKRSETAFWHCRSIERTGGRWYALTERELLGL